MLVPLTLLNFLVTLCVIVGGFVAYRQGFEKTANDVQTRVITALQNEIHALQERITALERENAHLNQIISTLCAALERRGIHIKVDSETVSIHDHLDGSCTSNTRIQDTNSVENTSTSNATSETKRGVSSKKRISSTKRVASEDLS